MSKIKGQNFRAFIEGAAVPEATNCVISINTNVDDSSSKDTEGFFTKETIVSKSWTVQVDSYDATLENMKTLISEFMAAQTIAVGWDQTTGAAGTMNRVAADASFARSGNALLNDLTFTFNDRQTVSVSSQYQGSGALS